MQKDLYKILPYIEKPYRYIGGEFGSVHKDWDNAKVRICLAFPDLYELGMSNIGLSLLYNIINKREDFLADRVYAPWFDMEEKLRELDYSLYSIESKKDLKDFDIIGITLPYELSYTNVLNILDLSKIPFRSKDRDESYPFIIGGGPGAFNPEPIAPFFDIIVIGDGEEIILKIADIVKNGKENKKARKNILQELSLLDGVYVPCFGINKNIKRAFINNLETCEFPEKTIVPYKAVHDRVGIEIARGCMRGCRFCQAGFVYRPIRFRSPATCLDLANKQIKNSGQEDLSYLALSISDYPLLENLLSSTQKSFCNKYVNMQFPSLRTETLEGDLLDVIKRAKSASFTLAPEAGTERMRAVINKGNSDDNLYRSVEKIFESGWHKLKLYFMIGLPGETQAELDGIIQMSNKCLAIGRKHNNRAEITVSASIFVPKSHTPFQWCSQISIEQAKEKIAFLKKGLKKRGINFRWHNPYLSFLEGVFARGDIKLASILEEAYKLGCRFDAWDEKNNFDKWIIAFSSKNIFPESYLEKRDLKEKLPWDHLYTELKKDYLYKEYEKSLKLEATNLCSMKNCHGCGVCKDDPVAKVIPAKAGIHLNKLDPRFHGDDKQILSFWPQVHNTDKTYSYRIKFTKLEKAAFLGHLELIDILKTGFRRLGLALKYSSGFSPHPKLSFGRALSVGIESQCEFCDIIVKDKIDKGKMLFDVSSAFPQGINIIDIKELDDNSIPIEDSVSKEVYEVSNFNVKNVKNYISSFLLSNEVVYNKKTRKKEYTVNIKDYVANIEDLNFDKVEVTINNVRPLLKITDIIEVIFNLKENQVKEFKVKKTEVVDL